jgi:hypothetical protein
VPSVMTAKVIIKAKIALVLSCELMKKVVKIMAL